MGVVEPGRAVLGETDSGLDIDALQLVARGIDTVRHTRPTMGTLVITHYQRILGYLAPDHVHVLVDGRVVASGGAELARQVEAEGFDAYRVGSLAAASAANR